MGDFGRWMHRDSKSLFRGVTIYSRVWRKGARKRGLECVLGDVPTCDNHLGGTSCLGHQQVDNSNWAWGEKYTNDRNISRKQNLKKKKKKKKDSR